MSDDGITKAAADVLAERHRQITQEKWSHEHDDGHKLGELAFAAACYASPRPIFVANEYAGITCSSFVRYLEAWPFNPRWWNPKDRRSNLVKAGALILAEIERLDRTPTE